MNGPGAGAGQIPNRRTQVRFPIVCKGWLAFPAMTLIFSPYIVKGTSPAMSYTASSFQPSDFSTARLPNL